jgi:hypothetical protein
VNDTATVNRIASQAIWVPGDDAVRFTARDAIKHRIEDWTARRFRAVRFLEDFENRYIGGEFERAL